MPHRSAKGNAIYILPNLLTTCCLFSGFYSIVHSINGNFFNAAVAILIAAVFDGLDGRVARLTGTTSKFGMEYDSLSDLVAFGVAPGLLAYLWILQHYGRYGWLAAFLYVATTALRLARFNTLAAQSSDEGPQKAFQGLPCPAAAMMIATSLLFVQFLDLDRTFMDITMLLIVYFLSYLMVSSHPYNSFKHISKAKTFQVLVGMVLLLMVVATEPQITLFVFAGTYVLSGPLLGFYQLLFKRDHVEKDKKMVKKV
ncbi:MAG: CDP-diacylglycerol--serine O-phosphatidyltransferase [Desulfobulbaceae bacterium]|nr:CDP-diacylglycerol--serine O-phosphatidyltransferase [Desulfobulbaceae bacterium]